LEEELMRIEATNLNFHSTFSPQIVYVTKLLQLAKENYVGNEKEISDITGIPTGESTGKVVPHIYYAKYMGLIKYERKEGRYRLGLTKIGRLVMQEDPHMLEDLTKLLIHYCITDFNEGAPQWSYLFKAFESCLDESYEIKDIEKNAEEYFIKKCKMGVLKKSYESECFESLRIIEMVGSNKLSFRHVYPRPEYVNVYAYTLLSSWEIYLKDNKEITIDQLVNELKWNKPFGLDYETTLEVLDELSSNGHIKLNKQLSPITIIKLAEADEVLMDIYNSLI
jgi:hypothetical protein